MGANRAPRAGFVRLIILHKANVQTDISPE